MKVHFEQVNIILFAVLGVLTPSLLSPYNSTLTRLSLCPCNVPSSTENTKIRKILESGNNKKVET